jgi:hypothetical protein
MYARWRLLKSLERQSALLFRQDKKVGILDRGASLVLLGTGSSSIKKAIAATKRPRLPALCLNKANL